MGTKQYQSTSVQRLGKHCCSDFGSIDWWCCCCCRPAYVPSHFEEVVQLEHQHWSRCTQVKLLTGLFIACRSTHTSLQKDVSLDTGYVLLIFQFVALPVVIATLARISAAGMSYTTTACYSCCTTTACCAATCGAAMRSAHCSRNGNMLSSHQASAP